MPEASLRYVIVFMDGTTRSSRTEYIRGRNSRAEYRQRALTENRDLSYQFHLDLESRVYTAFELHEHRRPGWFARRIDRPRPSGRTVHVRTETIDTAERKQMFGYTARRVIIRTSYRYTPEDESRSQDSETDIGPRETGFPLLATRTHRSNFENAEGNIRTHSLPLPFGLRMRHTLRRHWRDLFQ